MIEDFSGGYYRAEMTVQPFESGPVIERGLYDIIDKKLYQNTNVPPRMRLSLKSGREFRPEPEGAMPTDVIGVPESMLDERGIHPSAEDVSVFIVKPGHATLFSQTYNNSDTN